MGLKQYRRAWIGLSCDVQVNGLSDTPKCSDFDHLHKQILNNCTNSLKYNQQDATLYNIIYYCQCCTCFRRFLRPSSGTQKLYTASVICQACLLLPLAASKLDIQQMCVQFFFRNQQSEYQVLYELMCWLSFVVMSPPARRSLSWIQSTID